jgi:hypothetical protein
MNLHIFNYKTITAIDNEYKICRINYFAQKTPALPQKFNISPKILEAIKTTNEIQAYNLISDSTNLLYFTLKKIFDINTKSVTKLRIYQVGIKSIDEPIFTIIASYLKTNPKIDTVAIYGKSFSEFRHLKIVSDEQPEEKDEILENEIQNVQHIFNLYQVLAKKTNLLELRIILFITHYNFAMLAMVIKNNPELKILHVRNIPYKDMDNELDYGYKEMNDLGEDKKDEIFVFFNYLFNLEFLEELQLTHFTFMSEIPFMAVQCAKTLERLKIFSLDKNVYLINNDTVMSESYNLAKTKIENLNMGFGYYHYIRRWDSLINLKTLKEVNIGVVDYVSFASLMRHIEHSALERVIVRMNKPVLLQSIIVLFDLIGTYPMRAKNLKYFYVLNAFDVAAKTKEIYKDKALPRLFHILRMNKTIRRLGFNKPGKFYFEIKDFEDIKTFKYIRVRDYDSVIFLMRALQRLFKNHPTELTNDIIKNVIIYRFTTYRKLITG